MVFGGFPYSYILQVAKGLKPHTPLLRLAGPEDPRGTNGIEGFLTRIFTIGERFETPIPHCCGWRDPRTQWYKMTFEGSYSYCYNCDGFETPIPHLLRLADPRTQWAQNGI
ncbi:Hypothetical protein FKW44_016219 [Caligus rogercresseyi]|uniref:Uncharacterized protein n=1 Tax=Caligus rogercresseyi TaxID=217165 RepID=A0A7T8K1U6_CALRO|nr:Hypothetical protein FKW44_016219 [Caligus rogercresseyi]